MVQNSYEQQGIKHELYLQQFCLMCGVFKEYLLDVMFTTRFCLQGVYIMGEQTCGDILHPGSAGYNKPSSDYTDDCTVLQRKYTTAAVRMELHHRDDNYRTLDSHSESIYIRLSHYLKCEWRSFQMLKCR